MGRLTFETDGYYAVAPAACWEDQNGEYQGPAIDRLAAYEDACLEPEEIKAVDKILGDLSFERLEEIMKAEQSGRLVVLPCKAGDVVYYGKTMRPCNVEGFLCNKNGHWKLHVRPAVPKWIGNRCEHWYPSIRSIGKTVFLTREEAEAALEAQEGGENGT